MSTHPDADAFVRAILANPAEVTTRLVFADWLEEIGDPSNVAWAHFIRLNAEIANCPLGERREELILQAATHRRSICARLTLHARLFMKHRETLEQLLPRKRLTVRLGGFTPEPYAKSLFTPQMVELYRMCPLGWDSANHQVLVIAISNTRDGESMAIDDVQNIFGLYGVITVQTPSDDIQEALAEHYPPNFVDEMLVEFTDTAFP